VFATQTTIFEKMKLTQSFIIMAALANITVQVDADGQRKLKKAKKQNKAKKTKKGSAMPSEPSISLDSEPVMLSCPKTGIPPSVGKDNSERLLFREGVIDEIPSSLCGSEKPQKNVILVVGDGMGWEMVRSGAVAKLVLEELKELGVDTVNGSTGAVAEAAKAAFKGRTLDDYYTEGKGHGLSFQELDGFSLMTTTTTVIQSPNDGAHYAPASSLLEGGVADHDNGMANLALDECGDPIDFDPRDFEADGGNMVLWDIVKGGMFPWDENYYKSSDFSEGFDPEYIMRHATDSASTAGTMATGHKGAVNMMGVDLYEEKVSTIIEDAMMCGKAGGVISSVPVLHATPGAFVTHSNYRKNTLQLQNGFKEVNPTFASGGCASRYQPSEEHKQSMVDGALSNEWTFLHTDPSIPAEKFYDGIQNLDPDDGQHIMVCMGGQYTNSSQDNLPYRGLDSTYQNRWCGSGETDMDENNIPIGVTATTPDELCDHYTPEDKALIPHMAENVKQAINFLGKDDDGFFLMYEQGDIDWAAHANQMDDMLGTMLDIDDGVAEIIKWIEANGGWEKNVLYITADHDHYLTLSPHFPEAVAKFIIDGESHKITPQSNSQKIHGVRPSKQTDMRMIAKLLLITLLTSQPGPNRILKM